MKVFWQSAHWQVNKDLAKEVWIEWALLLSDLFDKYYYFLEKWLLNDQWYFFNTIENIENDTTLTRKLQDKNIKILVGKWYLETKLMWVPATKHFKINIDKIVSMVQTSLSQKDKQDWPKETTNKNKLIIIDNNIVSKDTTTQSVDQEYIPSEKTIKINKVIEAVKTACQENNVFYKSDPKERNFATHLTGKKFESEALKPTNLDLETFIHNIIRASSSNKYSKKIYNCVTLYYNRADVINKHITSTQVTKDNVNYII